MSVILIQYTNSVYYYRIPSKDYTHYGSLPRPRKSSKTSLTKEAMLKVYVCCYGDCVMLLGY